MRLRHALLIVLPALGVLLSACPQQPGTCFAEGEATVKQLRDCERLCDEGRDSACNRRSQIEAGLSQVCHRRAVKSACKELCSGRKNDQSACRRLQDIAAGR